jgi:hypothetical protein
MNLQRNKRCTQERRTKVQHCFAAFKNDRSELTVMLDGFIQLQLTNTSGPSQSVTACATA